MLRNNKDIMLFSVGVAIAIFALFFLFDKNISGAIFGFLGGFFSAFYLLIKENKRQVFFNKAKDFLHRETVIFAGKSDIYDGNIAAKGCIALTLGNLYVLGLTTTKDFSVMYSCPYNQVKEYEYGRYIKLNCNNTKLELRIKDSQEFDKLIQEKLQ